jgi:hypothetical protein
MSLRSSEGKLQPLCDDVILMRALKDRREIDSIPKKSELRLVAYVILGAVGSILIFRDLIGWLFFLH